MDRTLTKILFISAAALLSMSVGAEECEAPDDSAHFVRTHDVGNYRGEADYSSSDDFFLGTGTTSTFCLNVIGNNNHLCGIDGVLTEGEGGVLRYTDSELSTCTLDFIPSESGYRLSPSEGWKREGACQKRHCGWYAEILPGVFN